MTFQPGDIVAIRVFGAIWHMGVVTFRGSVISASFLHRGVIEQPLREFANGKKIHFAGNPAILPPEIVVQRAESRIGEPWHLLNANCEHFAHWAHGLQPQSPQLARAAGVLIIGAVMGMLARA